MKFNIKKQSNIKWTFRENAVLWKYDIQWSKIEENFEGEINLPKKWNIWVIVWPSWTWKTTIARELFWDYFIDFNYWNNSVIDEIWKNKSTEEIFNIFNKVWFNTPKSWLKPYEVLSNWEKMRVDLANALLQDKEVVIFDEFTSVVDRQVAKFWSFAIQKTIRKNDRKFIAISCHYDILERLEPDWVLDTKNMAFTMGVMSPNTKDHQLKQKLENEEQMNGLYLASIII